MVRSENEKKIFEKISLYYTDVCIYVHMYTFIKLFIYFLFAKATFECIKFKIYA